MLRERVSGTLGNRCPVPRRIPTPPLLSLTVTQKQKVPPGKKTRVYIFTAFSGPDSHKWMKDDDMQSVREEARIVEQQPAQVQQRMHNQQSSELYQMGVRRTENSVDAGQGVCVVCVCVCVVIYFKCVRLAI